MSDRLRELLCRERHPIATLQALAQRWCGWTLRDFLDLPLSFVEAAMNAPMPMGPVIVDGKPVEG